MAVAIAIIMVVNATKENTSIDGCSGRGAPVISLRSLLQFLLLWSERVIVTAWYKLLNNLTTPLVAMNSGLWRANQRIQVHRSLRISPDRREGWFFTLVPHCGMVVYKSASLQDVIFSALYWHPAFHSSQVSMPFCSVALIWARISLRPYAGEPIVNDCSQGRSWQPVAAVSSWKSLIEPSTTTSGW